VSATAIVDTIIQGAAVDLLHSLEIAAAPLPAANNRTLRENPDFSAYVRFAAPGCNGTLCLGCPAKVMELTKRDSASKIPQEDWIRELTNQLMGRVKKRFLQFSVTLQTSLPAPAGTQFLSRFCETAAAINRLYELRTLRGTVIVLLAAEIDSSKLVYSGHVRLRDEGDIIIF
jgi:hypothetical protein